jgi:hypothetical protein
MEEPWNINVEVNDNDPCYGQPSLWHLRMSMPHQKALVKGTFQLIFKQHVKYSWCEVLSIEEFRRETNRNYKWCSWARQVAVELNARTLLLSRLGSRTSMPNSVECNITNPIGGRNQCLTTMMVRSCVLYLVNELWGYDVEF